MVDLSAQELPEPDALIGAPHPRFCPKIYGHSAAEAAFFDSFTAGRVHHAWLIHGPRGVGKASLVWSFARFLLAVPQDDGSMFAPAPPKNLHIPLDHPVAHRMTIMSEPRLFLLRRGMNAAKTGLAADILVNEVRKLKHFFQMSAADGGRRVAIIDAADELNSQAANALLKILEEPPSGVTFFLVAHQPWRLLPTLRSRCRDLRLAPLPGDDLALAMAQAGAAQSANMYTTLAELASGSVGAAMTLQNQAGLATYARLIALFSAIPGLSRPSALSLCETATGRGNESHFELILGLIDIFLARLAKAGAMGYAPPEAAPDEARVITMLAPNPLAARVWADLAQTLSMRARQGRAVNLDPATLLMDIVIKIDDASRHALQTHR